MYYIIIIYLLIGIILASLVLYDIQSEYHRLFITDVFHAVDIILTWGGYLLLLILYFFIEWYKESLEYE